MGFDGRSRIRDSDSPEEPGGKGIVSLCVDQVVGVLNDACHAAGLILIVQSGTKLIQNSREDLQSQQMHLKPMIEKRGLIKMCPVKAGRLVYS